MHRANDSKVYSLGLTAVAISILFSAILLFFMNISIAEAVTPLKYYDHYHALIEATVIEISTSYIPTLDTNRFMSGKPKEDSVILMPIERIHLRVGSILSSETISKNAVNIIKEGSIIVITNPWQDQKAPFKGGDRIRAEVQLVSTHEAFDPLREDNQWWFYNAEEKGSNNPPRFPFKYIKILY